MKTAHNTTLRVSQLTYLRIMDAVVIEAAELSPAEAIALISAVNGYLHSADPIPTVGIDPERLSRYIELIDSAARRSERARRAALSRRKPTSHPTQAPQETPTKAPAETSTQAPAETPINTPTETSSNTPTETPTQAPQETTQTPQQPLIQPIQNSKSQIQNSPIPTQPIQNSNPKFKNRQTPPNKFKIQNPKFKIPLPLVPASKSNIAPCAPTKNQPRAISIADPRYEPKCLNK